MPCLTYCTQGETLPFRSWVLSFIHHGKPMHTVIELKTRDSTLKIGSLESPVRCLTH